MAVLSFGPGAHDSFIFGHCDIWVQSFRERRIYCSIVNFFCTLLATAQLQSDPVWPSRLHLRPLRPLGWHRQRHMMVRRPPPMLQVMRLAGQVRSLQLTLPCSALVCSILTTRFAARLFKTVPFYTLRAVHNQLLLSSLSVKTVDCLATALL